MDAPLMLTDAAWSAAKARCGDELAPALAMMLQEAETAAEAFYKRIEMLYILLGTAAEGEA